MTNPVVDLVGDKTGRIVPVYPQSEKAGLTTWEIGDCGGARRCAGRRARHRRPGARLRCSTATTSSTGATAFAGIHDPESMAHKEEARRRLVFDELLRVQLALVLRKRHLERDDPGHRPAHRRTAGRRVPRPAAVLAHRRPASAAIAEIAADLAAPAPDAPAAAGRRRRGQDGGRGRARCWSRCRAATRAR